MSDLKLNSQSDSQSNLPSRRTFGRVAAASIGLGLAGSLLDSPPLRAYSREIQSPTPDKPGSITDVEGIQVGHFTDTRRPTGCTALLFGPEGAATGVDFDGSAPGTYQVSLLQPVSFVQEIWGIVLSGGSSFGLATAPGVAKFLEEQKVGLHFGVGLVPLVCGAIIYDLGIGGETPRPDFEAGYKAAQAAKSGPVEEGNVGAGAGATVGKMLYGEGIGGMKAGVGTASIRVGDVVVAALMVVNAVGQVQDWRTAKIVAGARRKDGKGFISIPEALLTNPPRWNRKSALNDEPSGSKSAYQRTNSQQNGEDPILGSTTIGVVATNAIFNKVEMTKITMMANCGAARAINPYHTPGDGDTLFGCSTRRVKTDLDVSVIGSLAAEVVAHAALRSATQAASIENWPAYRDYTAKLG
jgi:L-aminopeptidase/D-esterase-like protein